MFKHVMGKYPEPIYDVLREEPMSDPKAILDLGCGSGSWYVLVIYLLCHSQMLGRIIEAARDFPHCSAVGVDLVPMPDM
jgi:trans-aconitate methyltransferase